MKEFRIINFLQSIKDLQKRGELKGWDSWIILTHAYHESGAFKYVIGNHNYWGIKVPRYWDGKIVKKVTHEYYRKPPQGRNYIEVIGKDGKKYYKVKIVAKFVDFDSLEDALLFYERLVKRVYKEAYRVRSNYRKYFPALVTGKYKWATDPNYSEKLCVLYHTLKKRYSALV